MKRIIAVGALALAITASSFAQTTLDSFKTSFSSLADSMATGLAADSTLGSNWSDAYIGSFPHFGVGITTGAVFAGSGSATNLSSLGVNGVPSQLSSLGLPVPALGGSFKIGIPFLPIDVGVRGMYVPSSLTNSLMGSSGVNASFSSFGLQVRYAIIKQNLILPNLSIGAAYNYQSGSLSAPIGSSQSYTVTTDQGSTTITAAQPKLAVDWTGSNFDFTAQVSKQLLFLIPYLGVGASFGPSTVTGGVKATVTTNYTGGVSALNSYLTSHGGPTIDPNQGFTYSVSVDDPLYRIYGGISLRLFVVDFDLQAIYFPFNEGKLGAALTTRIQI
jgi:hypothetical protein